MHCCTRGPSSAVCGLLYLPCNPLLRPLLALLLAPFGLRLILITLHCTLLHSILPPCGWCRALVLHCLLSSSLFCACFTPVTLYCTAVALYLHFFALLCTGSPPTSMCDAGCKRALQGTSLGWRPDRGSRQKDSTGGMPPELLTPPSLLLLRHRLLQVATTCEGAVTEP